MAFFEGKRPGLDGSSSVTLVGAEASFHGLLTVKGSLRVEGVVEGDINDAVAVEVGKAGRVLGNIAAESVSVAGSVQGDVLASRHVELLSSSRVSGKIRSPKLRIEEGAVFDGQCAMSGDEKPHRPAKSPERLEAEDLLRQAKSLK